MNAHYEILSKCLRCLRTAHHISTKDRLNVEIGFIQLKRRVLAWDREIIMHTTSRQAIQGLLKRVSAMSKHRRQTDVTALLHDIAKAMEMLATPPNR